MLDRLNHQLLVEPVSTFLHHQQAKIETVVTESQPWNTGVTASGLQVSLDVPLCHQFEGRMQDVNWPSVQSMFVELLRESIRARVQATLVPADYCQRQVGKLDSVDGDGNLLKIKFARGTVPAGHVLKIGNESYGIIMSKALTTRHRVLLDRPIADKDLARGTPVFGCNVCPTNLPSFKGVTVVSNPLDDEPGAFNTHELVNNLHARISQTAIPGKGCDLFKIDMVCGLHVDPHKASMR